MENIFLAFVIVLGGSVLVVLLVWLLSRRVRKILGTQPPTQSKMKRALFSSGEGSIKAEPRRVFFDTYIYIALFVLFEVAVFILTTAFFVSGNNMIAASLIYTGIVFITLIVAVKRKYAREAMDPLPEEGSE